MTYYNLGDTVKIINVFNDFNVHIIVFLPAFYPDPAP